MTFLQYVFSLNRSQKRLVSVTIDIFSILCAFWFALLVRLDNTEILFNNEYWMLITLVCPVSIAAFVKLGLYRAILRYMGSKALYAVTIGIAISAISIVIFAYFFDVNIPRTVPIIYFAFALVFVGGSRVVLRAIVGTGLKRIGEPVIIYGAGVSGRQLLTSLMQSHEYHPYTHHYKIIWHVVNQSILHIFCEVILIVIIIT